MALNHLQAGAVPASVAKGEIMDAIQIYNALLQTNYCAYVQHTNDGWIPSKFHRFLCDKVQDFIERPTERAYEVLLLSTPPQHGKSVTITETLPSWYLGKYPTNRVIEISYGEEFSTKFGRRNRQKIKDYGGELFGIALADAPNSANEFELDNHRGGMISRGALQGVTGNGANLIIIDDPVKTREEAESETTRNKLWSEYNSSYKSRIAPGCKIIVIMTRWHEDDLAGRIIQNEINLEVINLPLEAEENDPLGRAIGDALCPEIGRDNNWLKDFKRGMQSEEGLRTWNSLFQGRPTSAEGNIIKREWWKYYDKLPDDIQEWIMSVDAAFKDGKRNDFVAIQVWGKRNTDMYLVDAVKEHLDFPATMNEIRRLRRIYSQCKTTLIEDKANGTAIITMLRKEMTGIIAINPIGGKVARVNAVTSAIESGNVHLPRNKNFTYDFVDECASFPNGKHDDQVDCMSQVLNRFVFHKADVPNKSKVNGLEKYFSNIKPKKPGIGKGEKIHVI